MQFGIDIPGFKWSPVQYVYKQWAGLYQEENQNLYVNRGFEFIGYQGRLGVLPEITLIELAWQEFIFILIYPLKLFSFKEILVFFSKYFVFFENGKTAIVKNDNFYLCPGFCGTGFLAAAAESGRNWL